MFSLIKKKERKRKMKFLKKTEEEKEAQRIVQEKEQALQRQTIIDQYQIQDLHNLQVVERILDVMVKNQSSISLGDFQNVLMEQNFILIRQLDEIIHILHQGNNSNG